jgi:dephospho-CoA kinase
LNNLKVGVTGGIGSGKSLACDAVKRLGGVVIDTDVIARAQAKPGGQAHRRIEKAFGTTDRKALAGMVFNDPAKRRKLERITHPLIMKEVARRMKAAKNKVVYVAVPLLFEAKLEKLFDVTMTVEAPKAARLRRISKRDGMTRAKALARMNAQLPDSARRLRADVVLENFGAKAPFVDKVRSYHRALTLLRHGAAAAR